MSRRHWTREKAEASKLVEWRDGTPYIDDKELVFSDQVQDILKKEYKEVPPSTGYLRWFSLLQKKFAGIRRAQVATFLANQEGRQLYRRLLRPSASKAIVAKGPGVRFQCDIKYLPETRFGGRKVIGIAVFIDNYSKMLFAYPIKTTSVAEMVRVLDLWFKDLSQYKDRVRILQTDNGVEFSGGFDDKLSEHNIRHIRTSVHHPTSNGQIERQNSTLGSYLSSWSELKYKDKRRWPEVLGDVVEYINSTWQRILKTSPRDIFESTGTTTTKDRLDQEAKKRRNSVLYKTQALKPGDHVRVSLRIEGDGETKAALKKGTRKGYLNNYAKNIYTVEGRRGNAYRLEEVKGNYDRLDLLKVPEAQAANAYQD